MKIIYTMYPKIKKQGGAAIVTAVFLLVILALLGQGMVSLLATSHQSINHEVASAKTYMAARTCLQWGMYQAQAAYTNPTTITGTYNHAFTDSNLFNTTCETSITYRNTGDFEYYDIDTEAKFSNPNSPEYSRRELHLQYIRKAPL